MVRNAKLVGQAIISYLQQKGYPEVSGGGWLGRVKWNRSTSILMFCSIHCSRMYCVYQKCTLCILVYVYIPWRVFSVYVGLTWYIAVFCMCTSFTTLFPAAGCPPLCQR